jgi:hypothetical protein
MSDFEAERNGLLALKVMSGLYYFGARASFTYGIFIPHNCSYFKMTLKQYKDSFFAIGLGKLK